MAKKIEKQVHITISFDEEVYFWNFGDLDDSVDELMLIPETELHKEMEGVKEAISELLEDGSEYGDILIQVHEWNPTIYKYQPATVVKM